MAKYQPFPLLWREFYHDAEVLKQLDHVGLPFDRLFDASRVLATEGPTAARVVLMRPIGERVIPRDPRLDQPLPPFPEHLLNRLGESP